MRRALLPAARRAAPVLAALGALLLLPACDRFKRPTERKQLVAGGDPKVGEKKLSQYGCVACHTIPGVTGGHGKAGPPLAGWADRRFIAGMLPNSPDNLVRFVQDPPRTAPGTAMPNVGVSEHDAQHIAAYLYTLH